MAAGVAGDDKSEPLIKPRGVMIVARHMQMEVLGISCITNMAAGVLPEPLDHNEVMETARRVRGQFIALLENVIERL